MTLYTYPARRGGGKGISVGRKISAHTICHLSVDAFYGPLTFAVAGARVG